MLITLIVYNANFYKYDKIKSRLIYDYISQKEQNIKHCSHISLLTDSSQIFRYRVRIRS